MMNLASISFVLPMYNESQIIEGAIKKVTSIAKEISTDYEIVIADDGSTDGSASIVERCAQVDSHIKVVHLEENTKFGGALKAGIKLARKDVIIYIDSDLPVSTPDIKCALSVSDNSDIVTACSKINKGGNLKRVIASKVYNFLIQLLFRTNIKDINSGFKIYKKKIFDCMELVSNSPFIDVEIFIKAMRKDLTIKEYPIIFKNREKGKSHIFRPAVIFQTMLDMMSFRFNIK